MATASSDKDAKPETAAKDLEAEIARLREDISQLTKHLASTGKTARQAAKGSAEQLRAQGEVAMEGIRTNAEDAERQLIEAVREKPLKALALAAGVGFLAAVLTRR